MRSTVTGWSRSAACCGKPSPQKGALGPSAQCSILAQLPSGRRPEWGPSGRRLQGSGPASRPHAGPRDLGELCPTDWLAPWGRAGQGHLDRPSRPCGGSVGARVLAAPAPQGAGGCVLRPAPSHPARPPCVSSRLHFTCKSDVDVTTRGPPSPDPERSLAKGPGRRAPSTTGCSAGARGASADRHSGVTREPRTASCRFSLVGPCLPTIRTQALTSPNAAPRPGLRPGGPWAEACLWLLPASRRQAVWLVGDPAVMAEPVEEAVCCRGKPWAQAPCLIALNTKVSVAQVCPALCSPLACV